MKLSGVCIFSIYAKKGKVKFPLPLFLERLIERKCHGILVLVTFSAKKIKSRDPSHWRTTKRSRRLVIGQSDQNVGFIIQRLVQFVT